MISMRAEFATMWLTFLQAETSMSDCGILAKKCFRFSLQLLQMFSQLRPIDDVLSHSRMFAVIAASPPRRWYLEQWHSVL